MSFLKAITVLSFMIFNIIRHEARANSPQTVHIQSILTSPSMTHLSNRLLPRRISDTNSHPQVISQIHDLVGCPDGICATLAGEAVQPLLAGAGECAQQDMADKIIDVAKTQIKDEILSKKLINLSKIYRQTERNTFPDYSNQALDRNSLYCQKSPKNRDLFGLVQKQSPKADPKVFFDPKSTSSGGTILKGSDPRTIPFGQDSKDNSTLDANSTNSTSTSSPTNNRSDTTPSTASNTTSITNHNSKVQNVPKKKSNCKPKRSK